MRNQHPAHDAPVATYAIGQIAFVSEHPILDTGGITRPDAIPYFSGPPSAIVGWAQSQGARYYIADYQPAPGAVVVFSERLPFVGWTFHTARYATSSPNEIWKFAPSSPPSANSNPVALTDLHATTPDLRTSNP